MFMKIVILLSCILSYSFAGNGKVDINDQFYKDLKSNEGSKEIKQDAQMQQEDEKKAADERFKRSGMKDRKAFDKLDKAEMEKNKLK